MTMRLLPTLAIDLIDAIVVSILLISVFGGWIASVLKKINEARNARDSSAQPRPDRGEPMTRRQPDTLVAPRRAPLKPPPVPSQTEPINLSMAERLQRARAKAEYEQRAKALRTQQGQRPGVPEIRAPEAPARARAELEARRRQELAQQQERLRHQAELREQQRRAAQLRRQQQQQPQPLRPTVRPSRRPLQPTALGRGARDVQTEPYVVHKTGDSQVHRLVSDAPMPPLRAALAPRLHLDTDPRSLRQAIILKEILDAPLALRNPSHGF